jgi:hypothetical protein
MDQTEGDAAKRSASVNFFSNSLLFSGKPGVASEKKLENQNKKQYSCA